MWETVLYCAVMSDIYCQIYQVFLSGTSECEHSQSHIFRWVVVSEMLCIIRLVFIKDKIRHQIYISMINLVCSVFFSANTICFMLWGKIVYWKWEMDKYALPSCFVFPQNSTNYFLIQWMDGVQTLKYKNAICILGRKIKTIQWLFGIKTSSNNNKTIKKYLHSWRFYAQLSWRVFPVFADSQPTFHR